MAVIDEPAAAIAASRCLMARDRHGVSELHPRHCGWCEWPVAELVSMVDGFNTWAGYDSKRGTYDRYDARAFQALPRERQLELITEAQDLDEPMTAFEAPARDGEAQEESVRW